MVLVWLCNVLSAFKNCMQFSMAVFNQNTKKKQQQYNFKTQCAVSSFCSDLPITKKTAQ